MKLSEKGLKIAIGVGIIAIAVIFLSGFFKTDDKKETAAVSSETEFEYVEQLQTRIKEMLEAVEGVGKAEVMITLEDNGENIYVTQGSVNTDKQTNPSSSNSERRSSQTSILLVEDENGRKQALLKKTVEPKIKGVVIVCEGGGNDKTVINATELVKTALNISATKICVLKSQLADIN